MHSKRWGGRTDLAGAALDAANNALLLERLVGVSDRRARFVCAAAWCDAAREVVVRGEVNGRIVDASEARGAHGFGYDPLFWADDLGATLAEVTVGQKQSVSHRGRAFTQLLQRLHRLGQLTARH